MAQAKKNYEGHIILCTKSISHRKIEKFGQIIKKYYYIIYFGFNLIKICFL